MKGRKVETMMWEKAWKFLENWELLKQLQFACLHKGLFVPGNWSASQCDRQWIDLKIPQKGRKRKMEMKLCTHKPKTHLQWQTQPKSAQHWYTIWHNVHWFDLKRFPKHHKDMTKMTTMVLPDIRAQANKVVVPMSSTVLFTEGF